MANSTSPSSSQVKKILQYVDETFDKIQDILSYEIPVDFISNNPQFNNNLGVGRAGINGFIVGTGFGIHVAILIVLLLIGSESPSSKAAVRV
jgi:hypothetical protein